MQLGLDWVSKEHTSKRQKAKNIPVALDLSCSVPPAGSQVLHSSGSVVLRDLGGWRLTFRPLFLTYISTTTR
jgi:hypothetical protein